jgi:Tfp pilus assembly protein PilF
MTMRSWLALALVALLAGCASAPPPPPPVALLHDGHFAPPSVRIDAGDVFALNDAMRHYLHTEIARPLRTRGLRQGLVDALYTKDQLRLEYDTAQTRNAAQAFEARSGNCLSLLIMTAALARELNLPVQFNRVEVDENWSRSADLYFWSGHVNLSLGNRKSEIRSWPLNDVLTIDFLPPELLHGQRSQSLSEATIIAMFMNNRAAEALVSGSVDDAYWWVRESLHQDPGFVAAYNTLGVVYLRRGLLPEAELALRRAYQAEPRNTRVIANLARVLDKLGQSEESHRLGLRLAELEPVAPFQSMNLGLAALQRGDALAARALFERELERAAYNPELHFWLAVASQQLGDATSARAHLALAVSHSSNQDQRAIYAAKLDRLNMGMTSAH